MRWFVTIIVLHYNVTNFKLMSLITMLVVFVVSHEVTMWRTGVQRLSRICVDVGNHGSQKFVSSYQPPFIITHSLTHSLTIHLLFHRHFINSVFHFISHACLSKQEVRETSNKFKFVVETFEDHFDVCVCSKISDREKVAECSQMELLLISPH